MIATNDTRHGTGALFFFRGSSLEKSCIKYVTHKPILSKRKIQHRLTNTISADNALYDKTWGCYRHSPPLAGLSTMQVPRWSLDCIIKSLLLVPHTPRIRTDRVQFLEAKA